MHFDRAFYREFQEGSTDLHDPGAAMRLAHGTRPLARMGKRILRFQSEAPTIIFGGAGSGKFANLGAYQLCDPSTERFFVLDIGGQYMSTSWHYNLAMGRDAYALNGQAVGAYPDVHHDLDLFAIVTDDALLFDKARAIAGMVLTEDDSKGENAWVGQSAGRWLTRIITSLVRLEGRVTPIRLQETITAIDTDDEALKALGRACEGMPNDEYSAYLEMYTKKKGSEREYGAIMGKIRTDLDWLSSRTIAKSISGDKNYFASLGNPSNKVGIYFVVKGGTVKEMQSYIRLVVGIAQLNCVYADKGARPLMFLEECGSLGRASYLRAAVSQYRKYADWVLVFQSNFGQLTGTFGDSGASEILESCGTHVYLGGGIRSVRSARDVADSIGRTTIEVDMRMEQADRAFKADITARNALWQDGDMFAAFASYEHELRQSQQQRRTGRYAIDPAELMRLKDQMLILTPGSGLQPVLAQKLPMYFDSAAMAGRFGPDPLFPPLDRVRIRRPLVGRTTRRFIRRPVPKRFAHWPNHVNGEIAYVQGYRTY